MKLTQVREDGTLPYLYADGKTQVTVEYDDGKPVKVTAVVVSSQHSADVELETLRQDIIDKVIKTTVPAELMDEDTVFYVNPTGRFVVGGPHGDSGLTGRKIIVDTYGGYARHGGGAFSGKDPTKVDRSAAYAARWVAKNLVAAGLADKCEVELAYAIGVAKPVSVMVDTQGTGKVSDDVICDVINKVFDLRPSAIIERLNLRRPIYRQVAAYGHMGREELNVPWEQLDMVDINKRTAIMKAVGDPTASLCTEMPGASKHRAFFYNLLSFSTAASTAFCTAVSSPSAFRDSTPSMVVPPGEHTRSISSQGCSLLSAIILALPSTLWVAICSAWSLRIPCFTPALARASINI